jgi:hypothetical protein
MIRDLRTILDGWDYEPGKISVRKIIGRDGREKIQTRIDLGVLQLECTGRPDGRRPHGHESLLEYHEQRLAEHREVCGDDEEFVLTPEECRDLRHEAYLFYQRYLSLFVLEEYDGVQRDTARNLRVIEFCGRYAAAESDRRLLQPQRAYVLMMHTRARAYVAQQAGRTDEALRVVEQAVRELEALAEREEEEPHRGELETLRALRRELLERLPENAPARLYAELEVALVMEDYERAAELRDRLKHTGVSGPTVKAR